MVVRPEAEQQTVTRPRRVARGSRRQAAAGRRPTDDTLLAAYLIEPGRATYDLDELAVEYGLELVPEPATEEETAALVRHAEAARRLAPLLRERVRERGSERLYDEIELPLTDCARRDGGRRSQDRHVPHG